MTSDEIQITSIFLGDFKVKVALHMTYPRKKSNNESPDSTLNGINRKHDSTADLEIP